MHLRDLTFEIAKSFVGTTFQVTLPDGRTTPMTLDEVLPFEPSGRRRARSSAVRAPVRTPFSLYLVGDPSIILPQAMYTLRSEALTLEEMFIVPIGQDAEATEYEAVFT